ncbi:tRNA (guanosine(46)-N7)-methyltransferase TrmB [Membranihabitans marinus]|uniref:tRNA (guanosine(46)-N7)-methyltransferase TrmB n=1 Tax=Membranihabitans marinus TaxID=1227546 RepID=UPI001F01ADA0|nr:tRNA (guanosine(46)-N7)-methyltransferase TrmB [Membranihabitans marinus]
MGKNKLRKFSEITLFNNVFEAFDLFDGQVYRNNDDKWKPKGRWNLDYFKNDNPIVLELACGKGDYTLALAKENPDHNFIGVDIKGNRIWEGATSALDQELNNVAFLRTRIEFIQNYFQEGEVSQCWITFPDPFLRNSDANRRLTSPAFLNRYSQILVNGGKVHLKTDDDTLYKYTLESFEEHVNYELDTDIPDVYALEKRSVLDIQTYYEKMHLANGKTIKYVSCSYQP